MTLRPGAALTRPAIAMSLAAAMLIGVDLPAATAAEVQRLTPKNMAATRPEGKEVDAIYGDYMLRNDRVVAVIANPVAGRDANLTVREVGGSLLDFTQRHRQSDQLSAYYPNARRSAYRFARTKPEGNAASIIVSTASLEKDAKLSGLVVTTTYRLEDGWDHLRIKTTFHNATDKTIKQTLSDSLRADRVFRAGTDPGAGLLWVYDHSWRQAYGWVGEKSKVIARATAPKGRTPSTIYFEVDGKRTVEIKPGKRLTVVRNMLVADNEIQLRGLANQLAGGKPIDAALSIRDADGPIDFADVDIKAMKDGKSVSYGRGRSHKGKLNFVLPAGEYQATVTALGRGSLTKKWTVGNDTPSLELTFPQAGYVDATITNEAGGPIPCKVQFVGNGDTKSPYFFDDTGEHGVRNVYYSHNGKFRQAIAPGKYDVLISCGPEYDLVRQAIDVSRGKDAKVQAKLIRTVNTKGWISTDYHSHSSPSGDNVSSQFGRVLNLLAEHIEFAPCTEHASVSTYAHHLKRLAAQKLMATCPGIELTGSPLPLNHQNAFPLIYKPYEQFGGGPRVDRDMVKQIERLAYWDDKSEKLVQQNHPNLVQHAFDRNLDGKFDGGYSKMIDHMDVIEIHPPFRIFEQANLREGRNTGRNRIHSWLLMLNAGYRVPGVVNTDSHYNYHGSGWLRNWVKSPTDDPAKIKTLDIVRASKRGNIVMSNGPFMEVEAYHAAPDKKSPIAGPGDDLRAASGNVALKIKVQCPNWLNVDRVQIFVNGSADANLNFTRKSHPQYFMDGVVKFDQTIGVKLKQDAHVIVATIGEGSTLQPVYPRKDQPVAVANPIFVDVDGNGFKANGDKLGSPLPLK